MKTGTRLHILLLSLVVGCSASSYERWADLQVGDILRDREQTALGYRPEVEATTTANPNSTRRTYEKIPFTPIAPPTTAPIEPLATTTPYGELGPDLYWRDSGPVEKNPVDISAGQDEGLIKPMGPPAPGGRIHRFDLFACLQYAVQHSRAYQSQMEDLYLAALDVTLQRHLFDLRPFAQQSLTYTGASPDNADYRSALNATTSIGVRQKLPYGGEVVAKSLVSFVQTLTDQAADGDSAQLVLSGSIPLLRGAGMINLDPLISAERNVVYQVRAYEDFRRSFAVEIASQYFGILTQQQGVVNRKLNLQSTRMLTERSQALFASGKSPFLDVQRAMQNQLTAESNLVIAVAAYATAIDNFKQALGMPIEDQLDIVPVALDVGIPRVSEEEAVAEAYRYRLALKTAADKIDDARRDVEIARNSLLPSLDLAGQASLANQADSAAFSSRNPVENYAASLTLDLPIDRVAERNAYRRSLINLERSERAYVAMKDAITTQVRDAIRGIRSAELNVAIQRRGIELAERRLDNSNLLLKQGKIGNRDVVDAQTDLLSAQDAYNRARGSLQTRVLEYMRDTGTLRIDPGAGAIGRAMDRGYQRSISAAH